MTLQADEPPLSPDNDHNDHDDDYDDDDDDHDGHDDHGDRNGVGDGNGDGNDDDGHNISEDNRNDVTLKELILSYQTRVHMDLGLVVKSQLKLFSSFNFGFRVR